MSGLIFAGIGKGIADAGTTFGSYMLKDIESKQLAEREAQREERLLARQAALDQLKADREEAKVEALKTRVATEAVQVESRAADAPIRRDATALGALGAQVAGDSPMMSQEEREALIRENPQYREVYRSAGLIGADKMDPRLRAAEDQSQAALELGAHSSVIDAYSKKRRDVLDQIRLENTEKKNDQQFTATMAAITERGRQADAKVPIAQQNADANTTRAGAAVTNANTPRGGGSDRTDQDITAAENALANTRAKIEKGYREPTMQEKYDPAALEAYTKKRNEYVDNHPDVKRQSARVERMYSGGGAPAAPATPKSGDNRRGESSTSSSAVARPTTKAEFDKLPSGATYVNPADGLTYRKK
jgi:hypothetical protein